MATRQDDIQMLVGDLQQSAHERMEGEFERIARSLQETHVREATCTELRATIRDVLGGMDVHRAHKTAAGRRTRGEDVAALRMRVEQQLRELSTDRVRRAEIDSRTRSASNTARIRDGQAGRDGHIVRAAAMRMAVPRALRELDEDRTCRAKADSRARARHGASTRADTGAQLAAMADDRTHAARLWRETTAAIRGRRSRGAGQQVDAV